MLRGKLGKLDVGAEGQRRGETVKDIHVFLTTEPKAKFGAIHLKAMPVILTTPEEVETEMTAFSEEALKLQRALPDGALRIVARGIKEYSGPPLRGVR